MRLQFVLLAAISVALLHKAWTRPVHKDPKGKRTLTPKEKQKLVQALLKTFRLRKSKPVNVQGDKKHEIGTETLAESHIPRIAMGGGIIVPPSISKLLPAAARSAPLMPNGVPASYGESMHNLFLQHPMLNVPHISTRLRPTLVHESHASLYGVHSGHYHVPSPLGVPEFVWDHSTHVSGDNGPGMVFIGGHHGPMHGGSLMNPYYRHAIHVGPQAPIVNVPGEMHNKDAAFHAAMRQYAFEEARFAHDHGFHPYQYFREPALAPVHRLNYVEPEQEYYGETTPLFYHRPLVEDPYGPDDY